MLTIQHFIDGRYVDAASGQWFDKIDPATGHAVAHVPDSDGRDVDAAVDAAARAFPPGRARRRRSGPGCCWPSPTASTPTWKNSPWPNASTAANRCGGRGRPRFRGRPPTSATSPRPSQHFHSEAYRTDQLALNYTLRQPRGVAGLLSPWNLPLYLFTWKVAPALATGNTVVAKPSELTPTTAHLLAEICQEVGLPPGVLNVVHGYGHKVGAALVAHPAVPTISFTGGTAVGAEIARSRGAAVQAPDAGAGRQEPQHHLRRRRPGRRRSRPSLRAAFDNQGEICLCGSRIFVEESVYPHFVDAFIAATRRLKVGDPLDPATDQGALISRRHLERVLSYIDLAKAEGGRVLCGGESRRRPVLGERCKDGAFLEPTVIVDLDVNCRVNQEEIFGPVVTITPFRTEDEVVAYANAAPFGLSASLWTQQPGPGAPRGRAAGMRHGLGELLAAARPADARSAASSRAASAARAATRRCDSSRSRRRFASSTRWSERSRFAKPQGSFPNNAFTSRRPPAKIESLSKPSPHPTRGPGRSHRCLTGFFAASGGKRPPSRRRRRGRSIVVDRPGEPRRTFHSYSFRMPTAMSSDRVPMTREGYDKLKTDLERMQTVEMVEVAKRIATAREMGDLSENAEYHAAREDQGMLQARIDALRDKLARANIVDRSSLPDDTVVFGTRVRLKNQDSGEEETYDLVGPGDEDYDNNKILTTSPRGQALLGKKVGDLAVIKVPRGSLRYKVLEITFAS